VSGYVKQNLPILLASHLTSNRPVQEALTKGFLEVDKGLGASSRIDCEFSGSTCSVAFLTVRSSGLIAVGVQRQQLLWALFTVRSNSCPLSNNGGAWSCDHQDCKTHHVTSRGTVAHHMAISVLFFYQLAVETGGRAVLLLCRLCWWLPFARFSASYTTSRALQAAHCHFMVGRPS
jgi:hypothetical protein